MPLTQKIYTFMADLGPSLMQFLRDQQRCTALLPALSHILHAVATAGKMVNSTVRKLGLTNMIGSQGIHNPSGDVQQKLDLYAQACLVHMLHTTGEVCAVLSEEVADVIPCNKGVGAYIVALDPLDGSLNIASNAAMGIIFSIYRRYSSGSTSIQKEDILQAGSKQLAAGYILYGTSTMLVYTACHGVHGFTYDPVMDDFFLSHPTIQMPQEGRYYAVNDGYFSTFPNYVQHYITQCRSKQYAARYMGALVADFHRHLMQGGIYLYPPTKKNPSGKLRLVLECNALALIAEQAGGAAHNGKQAILTIQPQAIHQRVPLYIGAMCMVKKLVAGVARTTHHPHTA